jgi:hypothetical protein
VTDVDDTPMGPCRNGHRGEWARYWRKGNRKGRWVCLACYRIAQRGVDAKRRAAK